MNKLFRMQSLMMVTGMFLLVTTANAHDANDQVVPESEYETATRLGLEGPAKTRGISSVEKLGALELAEEFPAMGGHQFRARRITIEPGGIVAIHRHEQRPGFAYILEGELIEHRNDHPDPLVRKQGDVAMEKTGVAHWWENQSGEVVQALVIDIIPNSVNE